MFHWLRKHTKSFSDKNCLKRQIRELKVSLETKSRECAEHRRLRNDFAIRANELEMKLAEFAETIKRHESTIAVQEMEIAALTKFHELTLLRMSNEVTRITDPLTHNESAE